MKWGFKKEPTIRFVARRGAPNVSPITAVHPASHYRPDWLARQRDTHQPNERFQNCPGMQDWMHCGYIIPAHTDIRIKANMAGTVIDFAVEVPPSDRPSRMSYKLVEGLAKVDSTVKPEVWKVPVPWAVFTKTGYSAHVMPATYHSPFHRDLFMYPGIVDFDSFFTINWVITPLRECEVIIPAGTPLLQVIPFKREPVTAVCRKATENEMDHHLFGYPTKIRAAYRKFFHKRKSFKMIGD